MNFGNSWRYALEWPHYQQAGKVRNKQEFLLSFPNNLLQLNFWCEVMMISKIEGEDIPEDAVFYLSDRSYEPILFKISQSDRVSIQFKIRLAQHIFQITKNQSLLRSLQQATITACAFTSPNSPNADPLRLKAINQFLNHETNFINVRSVERISNFLKTQLRAESIRQIDIAVMPSFVTKQFALNLSISAQLKKLLVTEKKPYLMYLIKTLASNIDSPHMINTAIDISNEIKDLKEVLNVFELNRGAYYNIFWEMRARRQQSEFPHFYSFMIKYSSIKAVVLHKILHITIQQSKSTKSTVLQLIQTKNRYLLTKISVQPDKIAQECLNTYLKLSHFKNPQLKVNRKNNNINCITQVSDPTSVVGIMKEYWEDSFHNSIINYCLWILMERWISKAKCLCNDKEEVKKYKTHLSLALLIISLDYKLGSFAYYFPIEHELLQPFFRLQCLPSLLLKCPEYMNVPWFTFVVSNQLYNMLKFEDGYQLMTTLLKIKGSTIQQSYGSSVLTFIEHDWIKQKNSQFWRRNIFHVLAILEYYAGLKNFSEAANRLKKAIQKQVVQLKQKNL